MEWLPLMLVTPVLVAAAVSDIRGLRIPNAYSLILLTLFVLTAPILAFPEIGARVVAALAVFAVGFLLFVLRVVGGGDVKILSMVMLFIPTGTLVTFGYVLSASLLLAIGLLGLGRTLLPVASGLYGFNAKGKLPMGVPIALACVAHLLLNAIL